MRFSPISLVTAFGVCIGMACVRADEPAGKPIATVLGKPVSLKDLDIDKRDKTALRDFHAIAAHVIPPLAAKYIKEHRLEATPDELKEFDEEFSIGGGKNEPTAEDKELADIAKIWVEQWKLNKALYEKYGGRVIFQQAGLEPLDACRSWLKEEEKAGTFQIHDTMWRNALWEYYKPEYHRFVNEPDPFKTSWWNTPEAKRRLRRRTPQARGAGSRATARGNDGSLVSRWQLGGRGFNRERTRGIRDRWAGTNGYQVRCGGQGGRCGPNQGSSREHPCHEARAKQAEWVCHL